MFYTINLTDVAMQPIKVVHKRLIFRRCHPPLLIQCVLHKIKCPLAQTAHFFWLMAKSNNNALQNSRTQEFHTTVTRCTKKCGKWQPAICYFVWPLYLLGKVTNCDVIYCIPQNVPLKKQHFLIIKFIFNINKNDNATQI